MCSKCHAGRVHRVQKCYIPVGLRAVKHSGVRLIVILTDGIIFDGTSEQVQAWDIIYDDIYAHKRNKTERGWSWHSLMTNTTILAHSDETRTKQLRRNRSKYPTG